MRGIKNVSTQAKRQRVMRSEGRCVTCYKPHDEDRSKCKGCREKANTRTRLSRSRLAPQNRCRQCGAGMLCKSRYTRCIDCRVMMAEMRRQLRNRRKIEQRKQSIEQGLCSSCRQPMANNKFKQCLECRLAGHRKWELRKERAEEAK